jgi:hypothetical protein
VVARNEKIIIDTWKFYDIEYECYEFLRAYGFDESQCIHSEFCMENISDNNHTIISLPSDSMTLFLLTFRVKMCECTHLTTV